MKKELVRIFAFIVVLFVIGWIIVKYYPEKVVEQLIPSIVENTVGGTNPYFENDGIVVITVGTATPMPGERAQTGTAVIINDQFFMFDVGAGVVQKAENLGIPVNKLNAIFLTHYHSDHIMDLPNMISRSWVMGRKHDLHVYGPNGVTNLVFAANNFLNVENQYRVDHHGPEIMDISKATAIPHEFNLEENETKVVFQQDGIKITAFDVDHDPIKPSVGYVIEYNGKKVVLSGDTKQNALLEKMAQNADLLIHEIILNSFQQMLHEELVNQGMDRNASIIQDLQNYHTSPVEVVALANRANVKKLVLNHLAPAPDNVLLKNMYKNELKGFQGKLHIAEDGDVFILKRITTVRVE